MPSEKNQRGSLQFETPAPLGSVRTSRRSNLRNTPHPAILWHVVVTAQFELCRRGVDGVPVFAVAAEDVRMVAVPRGGRSARCRRPDTSGRLGASPTRRAALGAPSDEAPASGGFLHKAVEAEEQEDVAAANALLIQVTLCDARLAEYTSPLLPVGAVLPVPVRVEVEVGVQVDLASSVHAPVGDAGDGVGDVDVAVLRMRAGGRDVASWCRA